MKTVHIHGNITGIRAKVDGSLGLSVSTPELQPKEKTYFFELQNINLDMTFTPLDEPKTEEYRVEKDLDEKSPSTRLRGVLFLVYKQSQDTGDFNMFYRRTLEKIIEHYKSKLEPRDD